MGDGKVSKALADYVREAPDISGNRPGNTSGAARTSSTLRTKASGMFLLMRLYRPFATSSTGFHKPTISSQTIWM